MESTGVYWRLVYGVLEGDFRLLLVNARHVKHVPSRKTDVQDCEWLAQLLECGPLKRSFVPRSAATRSRTLSNTVLERVTGARWSLRRLERVLRARPSKETGSPENQPHGGAR